MQRSASLPDSGEQAADGITAAALTATTGPNSLDGGTTITRATEGYALTVENSASTGTIGAIQVRQQRFGGTTPQVFSNLTSSHAPPQAGRWPACLCITA